MKRSELVVPGGSQPLPTVSAIIPTFNRGHVVGEAVESVLAQTFPDFELIIVDDGSLDNTAERIAAFKDSRIRYIRQSNAGVAAARNRGAVEAHGRMLSFLDSDDLWKPEKLAREVGFLNAHPEVHAVFSDLEERFLEGSTIPSFARQSPCLGKWIGDRSFPDGVIVPQREAYLMLLNEVPLKPTAFTIRKDVFDQLGGGYEKEWEPSEDWEFFLRFSKKYMFGYLDHPLAILRPSSDSLHLARMAGAPSINLLLAEKRRIPLEDREARREVRRGISWQSRMLGWQHEKRGERRLAIRSFLFGFFNSGDPGLLMRAAFSVLYRWFVA
jgi:glycosyltransferase involved in cell wall biosynthesis